MAADVASIVQAQLDAYNARDLEGFLACYDDDIRIDDGTGQVMMPNLDAMRELYGQLFRQSPQLRCEIKSRVVVGNFVVDEEDASGAKLEGFPESLRAVAIYRVEDGRIVHVCLLI
ncbi:MAG: nuclear transport factor 2 family protein [Longimicrobiales bacterium]